MKDVVYPLEANQRTEAGCHTLPLGDIDAGAITSYDPQAASIISASWKTSRPGTAR